MSIKKYIAEADTTITNAYKDNLSTRATGSNMGLSDSLEVFSIYGQTFDNATPPVGELEKSRILVQFPVTTEIDADRTAGTIPSSGVKYILNLYNAVHPNTLPKNFTVVVQAISEPWSEGHGLDMEEYKDKDAHHGGSGSGWKYRAASTTWTTEGGQVHATPVYTATFEDGDEDLSIDITTLVDEWIATEQKHNYGVLISMSGSFEDGTDQRSYYTKKFFARGSEFFFKRPALEARWDSAQTDDRGNFYASGSLMTAADNTHKILLKKLCCRSDPPMLKDLMSP